LALARTDKYDAALIAGFGGSQDPEPWSFPSPYLGNAAAVGPGRGFDGPERDADEPERNLSQNPFASKIALKTIEGLVGRLQR
jgi:hypothetical protein